MTERQTHTASWHLVYAKRRQEKTAARNLTDQDYEVFLPLCSVVHSRRGTRPARVEPMFPRYLFVRLEPKKDNYSPIRSTPGVAHLVRFGDRFARLPDEFLAQLLAGANDQGIIEQALPKITSGDKILITDGVMAGYEAIFTSTLSKERVELLLSFAGRTMKLEAPRASIEKTS
ncbi:MAG: transcriptional antiterminator RfaH [Gammaproteobacteria bacterium]|jgi:transcriptional antiterminator RfaH